MRTPLRPSFLRPAALVRLVLACTAASLLFLFTAHADLVGVPEISGLTPATGYPGVAVTITGSGFTGAADVDFNGTSAHCWTVDSDTQVTAVVPSGATTGPVGVTAGGARGASGTAFTVTPASAGMIAYCDGRDGNSNIYTMYPDGSEQTRLTANPAMDTDPQFSPDRRRIVFQTYRHGAAEIYVMNADGSGETRLTDDAANDVFPAFSPDGRTIVFTSDRDGVTSDLYLMRADGSGQTRLAATDTENESRPVFTPDGRKIVFVGRGPASDEIFIMNTDGSNRVQLTDNDGWEDYPSVSPDGGTILFTSNRDGASDIYRMNLDGSGVTRLTTGRTGAARPVFSPDGARIAFVDWFTDNYQIAVMQADGSGIVPITPATSSAEAPSWAAGPGAPPTVTGFAPAHGYAGERVTITGTDFTGCTAVTFNGTAAAFFREVSATEIVTVVPAGAATGPVVVTTHEGAGAGAEPFTVDPARAGRIAFTSTRTGQHNIYLMNADGSGQMPVTDDTGYNIEPALSPDGRSIAFVSYRDGSYQLYRVNPDGSDLTRLTNHTSDDREPAFSPDGTRLAFASFRDGYSQIYVMNADGSGQTRLTDNVADEQSPAFSPDGRRIVYVSWRDGNQEIYVMNADGSGRTRLTDTGDAEYDPAFSPDGHTIAFISATPAGWRLCTIQDDGGGLTPLTNNDWALYGPAYSPDGSRIAVTAELSGRQADIYVMNADGSGITRLTTHPGADLEPSWGNWPAAAPTVSGFTPDVGSPGTVVTITGTHFIGTTGVAFTGAPALCWTIESDTRITAVVPSGAGTGPLTVTTVDGAAASTASFTVMAAGPGKIAFCAWRDPSQEIYLVNPDGSGLTRLTDDAASDTCPAMSPDGTRIAFVSTRDGGSDIYIMNADGSGVTRLTTSGDANLPYFSPDGRRIVFMEYGYIHVMNADGSRNLEVCDGWGYDQPAFGPDGHTIVAEYWDGDAEIAVMNDDGSGVTRLTDNNVQDDYPAFSPDGGTIVFSSNRDTGTDTRDLYVMDRDGSHPARLTTYDTAWCIEARYSPDGRKLAFAAEIPSNSNRDIYVMNADGSGAAVLASADGSDTQPSWGGGGAPPPILTGLAPDRGYPGVAVTLTGSGFTGATGVAFNGTPAICWTVDGDTQLTAVVPHGATTGPVSVTGPGGSADSPAAFTVLPAGPGAIVYLDERYGATEICSMRPDGSLRTRLTRTGDYEEDPCLSADGTNITFARLGNIYVMTADGSGETCLTADGYNEHPRFSPDGRKIVFLSERAADGGREHVYVMNADGSGQARVDSLRWDDYYPTFTADGRAIVFGNYDRDVHVDYIYRINLDGSGLTLLHSGLLGYYLHCGPDGRIVFYSYDGGNAQIFRMNADGSGFTTLTDGVASDAYPCFSPDGTKIVFTRYADRADLFTMNPDGSGQTWLTDTPGDEAYPYWGGGPAPRPLAGVTLAVDPDNTPLAGHAQRFAAHPDGGASPEFSFRVTLKDVLADFSHVEETIVPANPFDPETEYAFTPADPGRYLVTITARERGTADPLFTQTLTVQIGSDTLTGVTALTADRPSGIALDAIPAGGITLTAALAGTGAGVQCFFMGTLRDVADDDTATSVPVTLSTAWGGHTCAWQPTEPGYYTLRVIAADASYNLQYSKYLTFLVRAPSLTGLAISANAASGTPLNLLPARGVAIIGTPAGTGVGVQYRCSGARIALPDGTAVNEPFAFLPTWSDRSIFHWRPDAPGTYLLSLTARDATYNTAITKKLTFRIGPPKLTAVGLTADQPSGLLETNVPAGGILLTAAPDPADAGVEYFFAAKRRVYAPDGTPTDAPVTLSTAWGSAATCAWQPAAPGMYLLTVSARDTWYGVVAKRTISFLLKPASLTGIAALAADPPSGTADAALPPGGITLTATPQGSGAGARYFFSAKLKDVAADGSVTVVPVAISTAWGADPACAWTPALPGAYTVTVTAKDADGVVTYTKNLSYLLKSATVTGITAFTAPATSGGGTFTATIAGTGTGVRYRYQVGKSNGTSFVYEPLTDDTTENIFTFVSEAAGVYRVWVFAYDPTYNTSYSRFVTYVVDTM